MDYPLLPSPCVRRSIRTNDVEGCNIVQIRLTADALAILPVIAGGVARGVLDGIGIVNVQVRVEELAGGGGDAVMEQGCLGQATLHGRRGGERGDGPKEKRAE